VKGWIFLLLWMAWLAAARPASAHAVLQSSFPAHGSSVDPAPREVVLTFTEPVHPQASTAQVVDAEGRAVSEGSEVSPDGRTLRVKLRQPARGTYTVQWKVLSRVDGHVSTGVVSFGVGAPPSPVPAPQAQPPAWQVLLRWVGDLASLSLAGAFGFSYLVLPASSIPHRLNVVRAVAAPAAVALAGAALLDTAARALWLHGPGQDLWETLKTLLRTSTEGPALLLRVGSALLALDAWHHGTRWVGILSVVAALFAPVLQSHAWAAGPAAVVLAWLHLAGASVWVGGLGCFVLSLSRTRDREQAAGLSRAFSRWAAVSLAVVAATGTYAAFLHVPDRSALVDTGYGRWLAVKLAVVLILVALGAFHRHQLLPRLESARGSLRRLQRSVRVELGAASVILLLAAGLSVSPPARAVRAAAESRPLLLAAQLEASRVVLAVEPAQPGWNRFTLTVRDARGAPFPVDRTLLRLRKLDEQAAAPAVPLEAQSEGVYAAEGAYLARSGLFEVEVVLRRRGLPDEVVWFPLLVGSFQLRSDLEAFRVLRRVQEAMERLRTWRETEQITDGAGNVVVTRYAYERPDRLRFEVLGGVRGVLVGRERFVRTDRGWERDTLPEPFSARGPLVYLQNPLRASLGREEPCPEPIQQTCRVVLWESSDGLASFAAWVGTRTHRVYRLLMWAPAHAMTTVLEDFDAPLRIQRPGR